MINKYYQLGRWIENENRTPNPGDIIFYDWADSSTNYKTSDNLGDPEHVGIVEKVENGKIIVIEGNYSNSVKRRTLEVNGRYIRGYGIPKYDKELNNKPTTNTPVVKDTKIDSVIEVQRWLNTTYGFNLVEDNIYGSQTKTALVKLLQKTLGVTADGIYGSVTNNAVKNLCVDSYGTLVKILQAFLVCNGYSSVYVDGDFGACTQNALMAYQQKQNLIIADKATFSAFCK
jgi:hypothetical protein